MGLKMSKKRSINKDTQVYKNKIIRRLKNKLLKLWSIKVKERAGNKCETPGCNATEKINAHHIETYMMHPGLRYDLRNGVAACPGCHKFFKNSWHKSFIFAYKHMTQYRQEDLQYLANYKDDNEELTIEKLEQKIKEMEAIKFPEQPNPAIQNQQASSVLPQQK